MLRMFQLVFLKIVLVIITKSTKRKSQKPSILNNVRHTGTNGVNTNHNKLSNPEFYGDSVYKSKKIIGNINFSDLFKRIVNRLKSRV